MPTITQPSGRRHPARHRAPGAAYRWRVSAGLAAVLLALLIVAVSFEPPSRTGAAGQPPPAPVPTAEEQCRFNAAGGEVILTPEQAVNAATIVGVTLRQGLPQRASVIAVATALQESSLYNLDHGDRDSLGLFQQRPSQGWGTPEQIRDPAYATSAFLDELRKVSGYQQLPVGQAAQKVQRSAFPDAYAGREADAATIAGVLGGDGTGLTCHTRGAPTPPLRCGPDSTVPPLPGLTAASCRLDQ